MKFRSSIFGLFLTSLVLFLMGCASAVDDIATPRLIPYFDPNSYRPVNGATQVSIASSFEWLVKDIDNSGQSVSLYYWETGTPTSVTNLNISPRSWNNNEAAYSHLLTALRMGTSYTWRAEFDYDGQNFRTPNLALRMIDRPGFPVLLYPNDGTGDVYHLDANTFYWRNGGDATRFSVFYSNESSGAVVSNQYTVTNAVFPVGSFIFSNSYSWWVRAENDLGASFYQYSSTNRFDVMAPIDRITLIAPTNITHSVDIQGIETGIRFEWNDHTSESGYRLIFYQTNVSVLTTNVVDLPRNTSNYFHSLVSGIDQSYWSWHLEASNFLSYVYSETNVFRLDLGGTQESEIENVGVSNIGMNQGLIWWSALESLPDISVNYNIYFSDSFVLVNAENQSVKYGPVNQRFYLTNNLSPNVVYTIKITGSNRNDPLALEGKSGLFQFATRPEAPTNLRNQQVTTNSVELLWDDVGGTANRDYFVYVGTNQTEVLSNFSSYASSAVYVDRYVANQSTRIVLDNLLGNTAYYWLVEVVNSSASTNSVVSSFGTKFAAPFDLFVSNVTSSNGLLTWKLPVLSDVGLTNYVYFGLDDGGVQNQLPGSGVSIYELKATNSIVATHNLLGVDGLLANREYFWNVKLRNSSGEEQNSSTSNFRTQPLVPTNFFSNSLTSNSVVLVWEGLTGDINELTLFAYTGFASNKNNLSNRSTRNQSGISLFSGGKGVSSGQVSIFQESGIDRGELTLTNLVPNSFYHWLVEVSNSAGVVESGVLDFMTGPTSPYSLRSYNITGNEATFDWVVDGETNTTNSLFVYFYYGSNRSELLTKNLGLPSVGLVMITNGNGYSVISNQLTNLTSSTTYYWFLEASNISGVVSGSLVTNFRTLSGPPDIPISLTVTNVSRSNVWAVWSSIGINIASYYEVYFGTNSNSVFVGNLTDGVYSYTNAQTLGEFVVGELDYPNTYYYWKVIATNVIGRTDSTNTLPGVGVFLSGLDPPTNLTSSNITSNSAVVDWLGMSQNFTNGVSYVVWVGTNESAVRNNQNGVFSTTAFENGVVYFRSLSNLQGNTRYYWMVEASNSFSSVNSVVTNFLTSPTLPTEYTTNNVTSNSIELIWNAVGDQTGLAYIVYWGTNSNVVLSGGVGIAQTRSAYVVATNYQIPVGEVDSHSRYYWKVEVSNASGIINFTNGTPLTFATYPGAVSVSSYRSNVFPQRSLGDVNFSGFTNAILSWEPIGGNIEEETYFVNIGETPSDVYNGNNVFRYTVFNTNRSDLTDSLSNVAVTNLRPNQVYYWIVISSNISTGTALPESGYGVFWTAPQIPTNLFTNNLTATNVRLLWGSLVGEIQLKSYVYLSRILTNLYSSNRNNSGVNAYSEGVLIQQSNIQEGNIIASYDVDAESPSGNLLPNTRYHWIVVLSNSSGVVESEASRFVTFPEPPNSLVALVLPDQINLSWSLSGYLTNTTDSFVSVFWSTNESLVTTNRVTNEFLSRIDLTNSATELTNLFDVVVTNNLLQDTRYYWLVVYSNVSGGVATSDITNFRTTDGPPFPSDNFFVTNVTQTNVETRWDNLSRDSIFAYEVYYGVNTNDVYFGTNLVGIGSGGVSVSTNTTGTPAETFLVLSNLSPNTQYYFKVAASNLSGRTDSTNNSPGVGEFFTLARPATNLLASNISQNEVVLAWDEVNNRLGVEYFIVYSTNQDEISADFNAISGVRAGVGSVEFLAISNLMPNHFYYFSVIASNAGGFSLSEMTNFVTANAPPTNLFTNNVSAKGVTFLWNDVGGSTNGFDYLIYWGTNQLAVSSNGVGVLSTSNATVSASASLEYNATNLLGNTKYYWIVASSNASLITNSVVHTFITYPDPVDNKSESNITSSNAQLFFSFIGGDEAETYIVTIGRQKAQVLNREGGDNTNYFLSSLSGTTSGTTNLWVSQLEGHQSYYWVVDTSNDSTGIGKDPFTNYFFTLPLVPTNLSIVENFKSKTVFSWMNIPSYFYAIEQYFYLNSNQDALITNRDASSIIYKDTDYPFSVQVRESVASVELNDLKANSRYYWMVGLSNQSGIVFSETTNFISAPDRPTNLVFYNVLNTSAGLSWDFEGNATNEMTLYIYVGTNSNTIYNEQLGTGVDLYTNTNNSVINLTNLQVSNLLARQQYYWMVKLSNVSGSENSLIGAFVTIDVLPDPAYDLLYSNLSQSNVSLMWKVTNEFAAERYIVYLGDVVTEVSNETGGTLRIYTNEGTVPVSTNLSVSNLTAGVRYYWKVFSTNSLGGAVSDVSNFVTLPNASTNLTVTNGSSNMGIVYLYWKSMTGGNLAPFDHRLLLGTNEEMVLTNGVNEVYLGMLSNYITNGLEGNTVYYWKVGTSNESGMEYSEVTNFLTTPTAPTNLRTNNVATNSVSLWWDPVGESANGLRYLVYWSTNESWVISNGLGGTLSESGSADVSTTNYDLLGILSHTRYYWRVVASNVSGATSNSVVVSFVSYPGAVDMLSSRYSNLIKYYYSNTGGGAVPNWERFEVLTNTDTVVEWSNISGNVTNVNYYVYWGSTNDDVRSRDLSKSVGVMTTTGNSPLALLSNLTPNLEYYWMVVSSNISTGTTLPASSGSFYTLPSAPTNLVTNNLTESNVNFAWKGFIAAQNNLPIFKVYLSTNHDFLVTNLYSGMVTQMTEGVLINSGTETASLDDVYVTNNTKYYWLAEASNVSGKVESRIVSFISHPGVPQTRAYNIQTNNATFSWEVGGTESNTFHLFYSTNQDRVSTLVLNSNDIATNIYGTNQLSLVNLTSDTVYYWRLIVSNGSGVPGDSGVLSFSTGLTPPEVPYNLRVTNGSTNRLVVTWDQDGRVSPSFFLYYGTNFDEVSNRNSTHVAVQGGFETSQLYSTNFTNLSANTIYYWLIEASNSLSNAVSQVATDPSYPDYTLSNAWYFDSLAPRNLNFFWNQVNGNADEKYLIFISSNETDLRTLNYSSADLLLYDEVTNVYDTGGSRIVEASNKIVITNLLGNTRYYIAVVVSNSSGLGVERFTDSIAYRFFETHPAAPTNLITNNLNSTLIGFEWFSDNTRIENLIYHLYFVTNQIDATNSNPPTNVIYNVSVPIQNSADIVSSNFLANHIYYLNIIVSNELSSSFEDSTVFQFLMPPYLPTNLMQHLGLSNLSSNSALVTWTHEGQTNMANFVYYGTNESEVRAKNLTGAVLLSTNDSYLADSNQSNYLWISNLTPNTKYFYQIENSNASGIVKNSDGDNFFLTLPVVDDDSLSISNLTLGGSADAFWANDYKQQPLHHVFYLSKMITTNRVFANELSRSQWFASNASSTNYTGSMPSNNYQNLLSATAYEWMIGVSNSLGVEIFGIVSNFVVPTPSPTNLSISNITTTNAEFYWDNLLGVGTNSSHVFISSNANDITNAPFTGIAVPGSLQVITQFVMTNAKTQYVNLAPQFLVGNTLYYWTVVNSNYLPGETPHISKSEIASFVTKPVVPAINSISNEGNELHLSWNYDGQYRGNSLSYKLYVATNLSWIAQSNVLSNAYQAGLRGDQLSTNSNGGDFVQAFETTYTTPLSQSTFSNKFAYETEYYGRIIASNVTGFTESEVFQFTNFAPLPQNYYLDQTNQGTNRIVIANYSNFKVDIVVTDEVVYKNNYSVLLEFQHDSNRGGLPVSFSNYTFLVSDGTSTNRVFDLFNDSGLARPENFANNNFPIPNWTPGSGTLLIIASVSNTGGEGAKITNRIESEVNFVYNEDSLLSGDFGYEETYQIRSFGITTRTEANIADSQKSCLVEQFDGNYHGNNHSISNLVWNFNDSASSLNKVGMYCKLGGGGNTASTRLINNLNLLDFNVYSVSILDDVGALAVEITNSGVEYIISNITLEANSVRNANSSLIAQDRIGLLVGQAKVSGSDISFKDISVRPANGVSKIQVSPLFVQQTGGLIGLFEGMNLVVSNVTIDGLGDVGSIKNNGEDTTIDSFNNQIGGLVGVLNGGARINRIRISGPATTADRLSVWHRYGGAGGLIGLLKGSGAKSIEDVSISNFSGVKVNNTVTAIRTETGVGGLIGDLQIVAGVDLTINNIVLDGGSERYIVEGDEHVGGLVGSITGNGSATSGSVGIENVTLSQIGSVIAQISDTSVDVSVGGFIGQVTNNVKLRATNINITGPTSGLSLGNIVENSLVFAGGVVGQVDEGNDVVFNQIRLNQFSNINIQGDVGYAGVFAGRFSGAMVDYLDTSTLTEKIHFSYTGGNNSFYVGHLFGDSINVAVSNVYKNNISNLVEVSGGGTLNLYRGTLIGKMKGGGIYNSGINGVSMTATTGMMSAGELRMGGLVGQSLDDFKIQDVYVSNLSLNNQVVSLTKSYLGGVVADGVSQTAQRGVISNVEIAASSGNFVEIDGVGNKGGVIGYGEYIDLSGISISRLRFFANSAISNNVGGLAGGLNESVVTRVTNDNFTINTTNTGGLIGGLVGSLAGTSRVVNTRISFDGDVVMVGGRVGGLVGNIQGGDIDYAEVDVNSNSLIGFASSFGGLVGSFEGNGNILNSLVHGDSIDIRAITEAGFSAKVGGFVGYLGSGTVTMVGNVVSNLNSIQFYTTVGDGALAGVGGFVGSLGLSSGSGSYTITNNKVIGTTGGFTLNASTRQIGGFIGYGAPSHTLNANGNQVKNLSSITGLHSLGGFYGSYLGGGETVGSSVLGVATGFSIVRTGSSTAIGDCSGGAVGGFAGYNTSSISNSVVSNFSSIQFSDLDNIGGFAGCSDGGISDSVFHVLNGNIQGNDYVGGFVGRVIVKNGNNFYVNNRISDSTISARSQVGGFAGFVGSDSVSSHFINNVLESYSVTGMTNVGGFVGYLSSTSTVPAIKHNFISNSLAFSRIQGSRSTGGFVGRFDSAAGVGIRSEFLYNVVTNLTPIGGTSELVDTANGIIGGFVGGDYGEAVYRGNRVNLNTIQSVSPRVGGFLGDTAALSSAYENIVELDQLSGSGYVGGFSGGDSDFTALGATGTTNIHYRNQVRIENLLESTSSSGRLGGYAGSLFASAPGTYIENTVFVSEIKNANAYLGGFVGEHKGGLFISNSVMVNSLDGDAKVAGFVGSGQGATITTPSVYDRNQVYVTNSVQGNSEVGGFFGEAAYSYFSNNLVETPVVLGKDNDVGGFGGILGTSNTAIASIFQGNKVYHSDEIRVRGDKDNNLSFARLGGFIGKAENAEIYDTVISNLAELRGYSILGGMVGQADLVTVSGGVLLGVSSGFDINSFINSSSDGYGVGGVFGNASPSINVTNFKIINLKDVYSYSRAVGGLIGEIDSASSEGSASYGVIANNLIDSSSSLFGFRIIGSVNSHYYGGFIGRIKKGNHFRVNQNIVSNLALIYSSGGGGLGGMIGTSDRGVNLISNSVIGNVGGIAVWGVNDFAGGIVGLITKNSANYNEVSDNYLENLILIQGTQVGGFAGRSTQVNFKRNTLLGHSGVFEVKGSFYAGGLFGELANVDEVSDSVVSNLTTVTGSIYMGGMVGINSSTAVRPHRFERNVVAGRVGEGFSIVAGNSTTTPGIGGMIGYITSDEIIVSENKLYDVNYIGFSSGVVFSTPSVAGGIAYWVSGNNATAENNEILMYSNGVHLRGNAGGFIGTYDHNGGVPTIVGNVVSNLISVTNVAGLVAGGFIYRMLDSPSYAISSNKFFGHSSGLKVVSANNGDVGGFVPGNPNFGFGASGRELQYNEIHNLQLVKSTAEVGGFASEIRTSASLKVIGNKVFYASNAVLDGGGGYVGGFTTVLQNVNGFRDNQIILNGDLTIQGSGGQVAGLVSYMNGEEISGGGISNVSSGTLSVSGGTGNNVSGLVGFASGGGGNNIRNVNVVNTKLDLTGAQRVGGVMGWFDMSGANTFENIQLEDVFIQTSGGNVGGIIGGSEGATLTISNISLSSVVITNSGGNSVGGLAGDVSFSILVSNVVYGDVSVSSVNADYVGGLVGYLDGGASRFDATGNTVYGNVRVTGRDYTGGMFGATYADGTAVYIMNNQINPTNGNVVVEVRGRDRVGGVVGYMNGSTTVGRMVQFKGGNKIFSLDLVLGRDFVGGFSGDYRAETAENEITNISQMNVISGDAVDGMNVVGRRYVGGALGYIQSSSEMMYTVVSNVKYVMGTITSTWAHAGGFVGYTGNNVVIAKSAVFPISNAGLPLNAGVMGNTMAGGFVGEVRSGSWFSNVHTSLPVYIDPNVNIEGNSIQANINVRYIAGFVGHMVSVNIVNAGMNSGGVFVIRDMTGTIDYNSIGFAIGNRTAGSLNNIIFYPSPVTTPTGRVVTAFQALGSGGSTGYYCSDCVPGVTFTGTTTYTPQTYNALRATDFTAPNAVISTATGWIRSEDGNYWLPNFFPGN